MRDALGLACEFIAERGICPTEGDDEAWELWRLWCELHCDVDVGYEDCWRKYFEWKAGGDG